MKKIISLFVCSFFLGSTALAYSGTGTLMKLVDQPSIYTVTSAGRYAFPGEGVFRAWRGNDFSNIKIVSKDELRSHTFLGNVTYPAGTLIKIQTDPKVYEVLNDNGDIKWLVDEQTAEHRHGAAWASLVRDVPDAYFVNYPLLGSISEGTQPSSNLWNNIAVTSAKNNQVFSVASDWNGNGYGVVWSGKFNGSANGYFFARLDTNGNLVGAVKNLNETIPDAIRPPPASLVWNGKEYGLIFGHLVPAYGGSSTLTTFERLDVDGNILSQGLEISGGPGPDPLPFLWNGQNYIFGYQQVDNTINGSWETATCFGVIAADGSQVEETKCVTPYTTASAQLAWDGTAIGIVYQDRSRGTIEDTISKQDIMFMRVDLQGKVLTQPTTIFAHAETNLMGPPQIAWDGSTYTVAWSNILDSTNGHNTAGLMIAKVDTDGKTTLAPRTLVPSYDTVALHSLLCQSGTCFVGWISMRAGNQIAYLSIDSSGNIKDPEQQVSQIQFNYLPHLMWDGSRVAIIWGSAPSPFEPDAQIYFGKQK